MTALHMVELHPDEAALFRFLRVHGCAHPRDEDLGYGLHAWLAAEFGEMAPAPFRAMRPRRGTLRVLGYCPHDTAALRQRVTELAEPAAAAVCAAEGVAAKAMPDSWTPGRKLGF